MLKRLLSASVISLALVVSGGAGVLASGTTMDGAQLSTSQTALPSNPLPLYCPPPVTSVVCAALPTPVPCKGCSTAAPAQPATATAAAGPALGCEPSLQDVQCIVDEILNPCQMRCAATTTATPALYCAPTLQDLQCVLDEILHPCQMRCATTAAAAGPAIDCNLPLLCEVLGLFCRTGCTIDLAGEAAAEPTSLPGDPCSRNWGEPVETICHL